MIEFEWKLQEFHYNPKERNIWFIYFKGQQIFIEFVTIDEWVNQGGE